MNSSGFFELGLVMVLGLVGVMEPPTASGRNFTVAEAPSDGTSSSTTIDATPLLPLTSMALVIRTATDIINNNVTKHASVDAGGDSDANDGNDGTGNPTATAGPDFTTRWGPVNAQAAVNPMQLDRARVNSRSEFAIAGGAGTTKQPEGPVTGGSRPESSILIPAAIAALGLIIVGWVVVRRRSQSNNG